MFTTFSSRPGYRSPFINLLFAYVQPRGCILLNQHDSKPGICILLLLLIANAAYPICIINNNGGNSCRQLTGFNYLQDTVLK